jgi:1-deoxy-D-xylulose-5-phosphate reductoisomerase
LNAIGVTAPKVESNSKGLEAVATHPDAETVVSAAVGAVGFVRRCVRSKPASGSHSRIKKRCHGGRVDDQSCGVVGAEILPVDSEHNAIHQCLRGETTKEVRRVILTASGGPFRDWTKEEIASATREQALNHPNWKMGDKITIELGHADETKASK